MQLAGPRQVDVYRDCARIFVHAYARGASATTPPQKEGFIALSELQATEFLSAMFIEDTLSAAAGADVGIARQTAAYRRLALLLVPSDGGDGFGVDARVASGVVRLRTCEDAKTRVVWIDDHL